MWYLVLYVPVAVWIYIDSKRRRYDPGKWWAITTVLIGPLTAPVYFAKRPLKAGETREGGVPWNILKNFALFWTLTLFVGAIGGLAGASQVMDEASNEYEEAGVAIGAAMGMAMLLFLWFVPMVCAMVLGVFLKKSNIVEEGPTGPLKDAEEFEYGISNLIGDAKARSSQAVQRARVLANDLKQRQPSSGPARDSVVEGSEENRSRPPLPPTS